MTTKLSTSQRLARLGDLINQAGINYYERIQHCYAILRDSVWIDAEFKGDEYAAAQMLGDKYLHDLSGAMTIWNLMQIYQRFPEIQDWQKAKYNLRVLYEACKPAPKPKVERRAVTLADHEAMCQELREAEWEVKDKTKKIQEYKSRVQELEEELTRVKAENVRLRARIRELEGSRKRQVA